MITVIFHRNPQNLSIEEWLKEKKYTNITPVAAAVGGKQGVRFGAILMNPTDIVLIPNGTWMVQFMNSYGSGTIQERDAFTSLLSSVRF